MTTQHYMHSDNPATQNAFKMTIQQRYMQLKSQYNNTICTEQPLTFCFSVPLQLRNQIAFTIKAIFNASDTAYK